MSIRLLLSFIIFFASAADAAVKVHGHRGARARFTENTLPAFDHALSVGVDVLELDVVVTKDNQLIVAHDPVLPPSFCGTDAQVVIGHHTLADLKKLKCRAPKDARRFPKQKRIAAGPLPTLNEILGGISRSKHGNAKTVRFNIETKTVPAERTVGPEKFAGLVVDVLRRHEVLKRSILQSFDHDVLRSPPAQAARGQGLKLAALTADSHPDYVAVVKAAKADMLSPNQYWITKDDVVQLHAAGLQVVPWTVNSRADWSRMIDLEVDGIISDDPGALIQWLKKSGHRPAR